MASTEDFLLFVLDQIERVRGYEYRSHRMFGEYCIYANDKPICFVVDNQVLAKGYEAIVPLMESYGAKTTELFPGSKPFYVLDIENSALLEAVVPLLEENGRIPKPRRRKAKVQKD